MRNSRVGSTPLATVLLIAGLATPASAEIAASTPGAYAYTSGDRARANIQDTSANGTPVYTNYYRGSSLYRLENNSGYPNTVTGASSSTKISAIRACQNIGAAPDTCSAFTNA